MTATAPGATPTPTSKDDRVSPIYWVIAGVMVLLAVIGLFVYSGNQQTEASMAKATELQQAFAGAGLPVPADAERIARSLGTDGGAVCDNPASALGKATLADALTNGGSFVGRRAVIVDSRVVQGEALILQVYCPEQLPAYQRYIDELKYDSTLKD